MEITTTKQQQPFFCFKSNKRITKYVSFIMALGVLNLSLGCNYYRVRELPLSHENIVQTIEEFNQEYNYAVINESWHLENLTINADENSIAGIAQETSAQHSSIKERELGRSYRYKKYERQPFNELHFKINNSIIPEPGRELTFDFTDIQAISVNDKNTSKKVLNIAATTVGVLFATLLIIAATKSSCPFVYVKNGEEYIFKGELYPGIITRNMQQPDYLPLPGFESKDGKYILRVTNELKEIQYTDFLELWVAEHTADLKLTMDLNGEIQTFSKLQSPLNLSNKSGPVAKASILNADDQNYTFSNEVVTTESTRELRLAFEKPKSAKSAKLLITAKNSLWLDYVFGKFNEQFGSYYNTFQKNQQELPKERVESWLKNQHIPLTVYLKTQKGWELVQEINTVGPLAMRDLAVPLSLERLTGDILEIKLQCGFMFWEVDYVGIDYTENQDYTLNKIAPQMAIDEEGKDVVSLLTEIDEQYLVQADIGNEVTVSFKAPTTGTTNEQSVFLINKGYYNYVRAYNGIPNFKKLKTFRENFTFTRYSENMYRAIMAFEGPLDLATNE